MSHTSNCFVLILETVDNDHGTPGRQLWPLVHLSEMQRRRCPLLDAPRLLGAGTTSQDLVCASVLHLLWALAVPLK